MPRHVVAGWAYGTRVESETMTKKQAALCLSPSAAIYAALWFINWKAVAIVSFFCAAVIGIVAVWAAWVMGDFE
ncbi:hypothetical protein AA103196_0997 [Ameyamaea chiangmaiensis NBRC 103196]|nr:hypothetical protein AA103196_0997 [Ameyamaea chiangmaiensis NBRC 103196]